MGQECSILKEPGEGSWVNVGMSSRFEWRMECWWKQRGNAFECRGPCPQRVKCKITEGRTGKNGWKLKVEDISETGHRLIT